MKLRLPHKFQAALMAALASVSFTTLSTGTLGVATGAALLAGQKAQAYSRNLTTTYTTAGDTTYNGLVYTMANSDTTLHFHSRVFQQVVYNEQGQWVNEGAPITSSNNDVDTPLGRGKFWTMYCSTSDAAQGIDFGNTLRLSGATSQQKLETQFTDFTIGGLITDGDMNNASATNSTYWFYRGGSMDINGTRDVNMDINSHVRFSYGGSVNMKKGGTWTIRSGKSLTFDNNSRNTATTFKFFEGQALKVQGGGALYLGNSGNNGTYNVEMQTGSSLHVTGQGTTVNVVAAGSGTFTVNGTITVDAGSTLNINQNTTLGRTITNAGTLTVANGKTVTLTSDLSGFEHEISDYIDYQGQSGNNGFINGADYTIVKNTGTSNLTSVKLAGASTATDLDAGRIHVGGTEYSTYYMNTAGAVLDLDLAVELASQHGGLSKVSVEATGANINVGSTSTLSELSIGEDKSATVNNSGAFTITTLTGAGALTKSGTGTLTLSGGGFGGAIVVSEGLLETTALGADAAHSVASGATLQLTANTVNATVAGDGTLRLMKGSNQDTVLGTVSATNVELGADSGHNSRFQYKSGSNLAGVTNLKFDGGQLWLNGKDMTGENAFAGGVTFNATTYTEGNQPILSGAAMRINNSATFNGAVAVDAYTKLAYASGSTITFGGAVTGSGQLDLKSWGNNSGTLAIAGDASAYTGAVTSDSRITLNVADQASLALGADSNLAGAVTLDGTMTVAGNSTISGAVSGTGSLVVNSGATLTLGGAGLINVGTLTMNTGSLLDVSNITQMAGITVNLASYTNSVSCTDANITGVNSSLTYTLNDIDGTLSLTFASKPQPTPFVPVADLGKVMYVGDSITDGEAGQKSWRYSFFQVLADGGISQNEEGYFQHRQTSGAITTTTYGGRDFQNNHSAHTSARSTQTVGDRTGRYDNTNIKNWLGISTEKTGGGTYEGPVYKDGTAPDTYFVLLGTNDTLSEDGGHMNETFYNQVIGTMYGYANGEFNGTTGTFDKMYAAMMQNNKDAKLVVLEIPTWSPNHKNNNYPSDYAYIAKVNQKLHEWADSKNSANITIVNPNPGIVDVANTTKPGAGLPTMYADGLHPSAQGELLIAGNVAKQLGYAGRSVGLDRASYTNPGTSTWTAAENTSITVVAGASAQTIVEATNAFTVRDGYTIDFSAVYGNGLAGGWSEASNALSITVGDGSHTGTLSFSEAYVMWDNTILYSRDNHVAGDNFRIAYVNKSVTPTDNVSAGYYVWMGDQLIGEALTATTGTGLLNGIQLSATGANGTVSGLTWANKAYAPTTELYVNEDEAFHLKQAYANPVHDNPEHSSLNINFTDATPVSNQQYATGGQPAEGKLLAEHTNFGNSWFGPAGHNHTGNIEVEYSGVTSGLNMFGVNNAAVTGDVSTVIGGGSTFGKGEYSSSGQCSIIGAFRNGNVATSISGTLSIEINDATMTGHILMGTAAGTASIGATDLRINSGAVVNGNIFGGHHQSTGSTTGDANITITGGTINGSVYGGNMGAGTIGGNVNITITGGIITGDVNGGGTGGTITGKTNVTIEGNLPAISGNISADNVTLSTVSLNEHGYTDGFDYYRGTITGTETITLDNYTVEHLRAALVTKTLVLSKESSTTIHNLTLTACTITANENTDVTLADSLTLGNTATFSGDVSLADNLTIDVSALMQGSPGDRITLFSGTEGSTLGVNNLSSISVTGSGVEDYHLTLGASGQYLYLDRNATALIPWADPSEDKIGYQGLNQPASGNYVAGAHVEEIEGHTGTGVYTSVTSGTGVGTLYANQGAHTGDVYMLVNGVTMVNNKGAYGWIAAHNNGMLTGNASVKVENSGNGPAMLFGVVSGNVTGNVYTEVDDGTFASFTTSGARASYAGSYQGNITGEARLVTAGGTFEYDVYGGVHTNVKGGTNSIGSTTLDLRGGAFKGNVYGGGVTGSVTRDTNVTISGTAVVDGNVYGGGGTNCTVYGSTNVTISGDDAQVKGNVYGNTDSAQGGTVTLKDRTNGFSNTGVILTKALNIQNTQGAVSSQITAETVNLTDSSTVTINNLTLTPTSDADTCALTMAPGSALTLGGTLSLSDTATYTGALTLTDGMTLDLSRMQLTGSEEGPVTLLSSTDGALTYQDLSSYHVTFGPAVIDTYSLSVDSDNNLVLTFAQNLVWNGGDGDWNDTLAWHDEADVTRDFRDGANVTFNTGSVEPMNPDTVTLGSNVTVGTMKVEAPAGDAYVEIVPSGDTAPVITAERVEVDSMATAKIAVQLDTDELVLADWATLELAPSGNAVLDAVVSSAETATLTKGGDGKLSLTGDNSDMQGFLEVKSGTLEIASATAMGSSNVIVDTGAELELTTSASASSLSLNDGSTLKFNRTSALTLDTLTLDEDGSFTFDFSDYRFDSDGSATLVSFTGSGDGFDGDTNWVVLDNLGPRVDATTAELRYQDNSLVLNYTYNPPRDLVWQGGPGTWDIASDNKVWFESDESQNKVAFETGDNVSFKIAGDSPLTIGQSQITVGNVTIDAGVNVTLESEGSHLDANEITVDGNLTVRNVAISADSMVINEGGHATANVEGSRTGALATNVSGAGDVTKMGTGNLALTGDNSGFTGTLTIENGAVVAGSAKALGDTPNVVLAGGNLAGANGVTVAPTDDINITSTQSGTISANMQVAEGATLTFNTDANTTITDTGVISGSGSIVKDGTGTLVLANDNTYTGGLDINHGTVLVSNVGALGGEGSQRVNVSDGGSLKFDSAVSGTYTADYIALDRGAVLTFAGTNQLDIDTLYLTAASAVDLSNITVDHYGDYILANVGTLQTAETGLLKGGVVQYVSMVNFKPVETWSLKDNDLISLHYRNGQLILEVNEANTPAYYWKPSNESNPENPASWNTSDPVWYSTADFSGNKKVFPNSMPTAGKVGDSVYFLSAGEDGVEYIDLDIASEMIYVRDLIIAGGRYDNPETGESERSKFYFTATTGSDTAIKLDVNRLSNCVVRGGTEANFINAYVNDGDYDVIHICKDAVMNVSEVDQFGVYSMNNEGTVTVHGLGVGIENMLGHLDNTGTMELYFEDYGGYLYVGQVANREKAKLVISAPNISRDAALSYGDGIIHNNGDLTFDVTGYTESNAMNVFLPVIGENSTMNTVGDGQAVVYFLDSVVQDEVILEAYDTRFSGGADLGEVELKNGGFATFSPHELVEWHPIYHIPYRTGEYTEKMEYDMAVVTAGADSTLTAEKGAIVTMDSFNSDQTGSTSTGKILVGTNPHGLDSSFPDASLTVEGVTKAAELEVQSGTATLKDTAQLGILDVQGGTADLKGYATVTTLTQSGGTANFNAGGFVDYGTVSGGTLAIGDDQVLTLGHVVTIEQGGGYTVAETSGSINADALTLEENMDNAQYLEAVSGGETDWQSGFLEGGQQMVKVFELGEGASLDGNDVIVTHKDAAGPMTLISEGDYAGYGYLDTTDPVYATYYVRDNYVTGVPGARGGSARQADYVALSDVIEASKGEGETPQLTSVVFDRTAYNNKDGIAVHGSITVDVQNQHADLFHVTKDTVGVVNIGNDAQGKRVVLLCGEDYAGVDGDLKLAGTGIYQIENRGDLGENVSLLADTTDGITPWAGTVRLTGTAEGVNTTPLSVGEGTTASTIEFNQWTGSFAYEEGKTMKSDAKILLTGTGVQGDPAITLTEGDANLLWTNTVSGQGARIDHAEGGNFTLAMTGDTSDWNGTFNQAAEGTTVALGFLDNVSESGVQSASVLASAGTMDVTYGGKVKTVNGDAVVYGTGDMNLAYTGTGMQVNSNISKYNGQGTMDVTVGDGTNAASATFNGDITADTLTVNTKAGATLHNTTEISDIVEVEAGASLSIQNTAGTGMATITTSEDATDNATITGGVTMKSADGQASIAGTAGEELVTRVDGADVAVLGNAASLQIENLVLAADTMVHGTGNDGSLVISDTVVQEMRDINAKHTKPDSTITSALTMTGTTDTTLEYDKDKVYNVDFTSMCQMAQISGSAGTLVFDFTEMPEYYDWEKTFSGYGFVGVNFDIDDKAIDASHLTVTALTKAADGQVVERIGYYYNGGNGAVVGSIVYFQVPEPTTSTLSLLALAALAARRRRK